MTSLREPMILEKFNDFSNQIEFESNKIISKTNLPIAGVVILRTVILCIYIQL